METLFGVSMDIIMVVVLALSIAVLLAVGYFAWRKPVLARLALRNIPRRRSQTALIVLGLMLATLLITAAFGTGDTMTYSLRQAFTESLGGTDLSIQKSNPILATSDSPGLGQAAPTFDQKVLEDLKAKFAGDGRVNGWSGMLQRTAPLIDTTTRQGSGQTSVHGVGPDMAQTVGDLHALSGQVIDLATLAPGQVLLDQSAADKLNAHAGDDVQMMVNGKPYDLKVRDTVVYGSPSSQNPTAFMALSQLQQAFNLPGQITEIDISLAGSADEALKNSDDVAKKLEGMLDKSFTVDKSRQQAINGANLIGNLFTTIFVGTALFSIVAGVMLIFLIFSMLAAERKSEMGMARAVGTQRGHLTQMFLFEGLAYDLASAAVGAVLGILVGFAMVGIISSALGQFGFQLTPHVELRSLVVAYCLGMLITFLTVFVSAARVSRLNIVAAIRDIPDAPRPEKSLTQQVIEPFNLLGSGQPLAAIGALFGLAASLFKSGPVTGGLGILLMAAGWLLKISFFFHLGASMALVAVGLTLRWILRMRRVRPATRDRIAFSTSGLLLLIYWALPVDSLHNWFGVPDFGVGIEQFVIGGIAMVIGAVWAVMYNSDLLLHGLTFVLGPFGRLRPVLKTAVAYPMSSIFRTGLAVAMFALIMFVLILMSVLTNLNKQLDPGKPEVTGGYQLQASVPFANPVKDINASIQADPALKDKFDVIAGETLAPLQMRQVGVPVPTAQLSEEMQRQFPGMAQGWRYYSTRLVDQSFINTNQFKMMIRARGYDSDRAVWDAIAKDPTLAVVDYVPVVVGEQLGKAEAFGGSEGFARSPIFYIRGVKTSNPVMDPVEVELSVPGLPNGQSTKIKIIGVLSQEANYFTGLYLNRDLAKKILPVALPTTTYLFRLKPGVDPDATRRALGSAFLNNGMEPVVIADQLRQQQAVGGSLNGLLQGFMTLGLIVGVAALGVISTRAVVERRQQIGVLRAIGYQKGMIASSFMLESSFIAMLGIMIGVVLGLVLSYNLVQFFAKDTPTVTFDVPWLQIAGIIALAYVVSLVTTVLPARSAAQIYPAEALRYE